MKYVSFALVPLLIGGLTACNQWQSATTNSGANDNLVSTSQANMIIQTRSQLPVHIGGNQQTTVVSDQNANQINQSAVSMTATANSTSNSVNSVLQTNSSATTITHY